MIAITPKEWPVLVFANYCNTRRGLFTVVVMSCILFPTGFASSIGAEQATGGKVLLFPYGQGFTSRLVDMIKMGRILRQAGYEVTFLTNADDRKHIVSKLDVEVRTFPSPAGYIPLRENESQKAKYMEKEKSTSGIIDTINTLVRNHVAMCDMLLQQNDLLTDLKNVQYNLLILDFADSCGRILCQYLDIPTITYSSTGLTVDYVLFPNLPSFVPMPMSGFSGNMTFWQRVQNTLMSLVMDLLLAPLFYGSFEGLQEKYGLTSPMSLRKAFVHHLHLVHGDFVLEEPRPLLPNVVLTGGMFVDEPQPLETDLESFMVGSGESGVVVVSFGSLIQQLDDTKAEIIAGVLARLKQRVVWRYVGAPPKGVGANTRLLAWIPQNDLLSHPRTRAFVTHCGIHGSYEALYHGVPVVAVPLMFDQHDNARKLVKRAGMGTVVDFKSLDNASLSLALNQVLADSTYRQNAINAARSLRDNPLAPRETFLFWTKYLIRNKGIGKLKMEAVKYLHTFQLFCIDVYIFIVCVSAIVVFGFLYICMICCRYICPKKTRIKVKVS